MPERADYGEHQRVAQERHTSPRRTALAVITNSDMYEKRSGSFFSARGSSSVWLRYARVQDHAEQRQRQEQPERGMDPGQPQARLKLLLPTKASTQERRDHGQQEPVEREVDREGARSATSELNGTSQSRAMKPASVHGSARLVSAASVVRRGPRSSVSGRG